MSTYQLADATINSGVTVAVPWQTTPLPPFGNIGSISIGASGPEIQVTGEYQVDFQAQVNLLSGSGSGLIFCYFTDVTASQILVASGLEITLASTSVSERWNINTSLGLTASHSYQFQFYQALGATYSCEAQQNGVAATTLSMWQLLSVGPTGAAGATGAQGSQGPQGPVGSTGLQGPQGPLGLQGPNGAVGATGLQGPQGSQGPAGVTGAGGATGVTGTQGTQGPQGAGLQGSQGPQGTQGPIGASGLAVPTPSLVLQQTLALTRNSYTSVPAADWSVLEHNVLSFSGSTVSGLTPGLYSVTLTVSGDDTVDQSTQVQWDGFDLSDGTDVAADSGAPFEYSGSARQFSITALSSFYVYSSGESVDLSALQAFYSTGGGGAAPSCALTLAIVASPPVGPQGPQGPQGAGLTGPQGQAGPTGPAGGPQGAQGPRGSQGTQGEQGFPGLNGATGPTGPALAWNGQERATLYVSGFGNDANDGGPYAPFLTIVHALSVIAGYGDAAYDKTYLILLFPGNYDDAVELAPYVFIEGISQTTNPTPYDDPPNWPAAVLTNSVALNSSWGNTADVGYQTSPVASLANILLVCENGVGITFPADSVNPAFPNIVFTNCVTSENLPSFNLYCDGINSTFTADRCLLGWGFGDPSGAGPTNSLWGGEYFFNDCQLGYLAMSDTPDAGVYVTVIGGELWQANAVAPNGQSGYVQFTGCNWVCSPDYQNTFANVALGLGEFFPWPNITLSDGAYGPQDTEYSITPWAGYFPGTTVNWTVHTSYGTVFAMNQALDLLAANLNLPQGFAAGQTGVGGSTALGGSAYVGVTVTWNPSYNYQGGFSAANGEFTAGATGLYQTNVSALCINGPTGGQLSLILMAAGTTYNCGAWASGNTLPFQQSFSALLPLNAGNTCQLQVASSSGDRGSVKVPAFSIFQVGASS
jgi:hypothetical protein